MADFDAEQEVFNLDFDVSRSLRYHAYRRSFWNALDFVAKASSAISGTAVLVSVIGDAPVVAQIFAFVVAIASSSDLILGFNSKSRQHDTLYRSFSLLLQEIVKAQLSLVDPNHIATWKAKVLEIEMEEPNTLDLLERRCAAEESFARGLDPRPIWKLGWWGTIFSQWPFPTRRETYIP